MKYLIIALSFFTVTSFCGPTNLEQEEGYGMLEIRIGGIKNRKGTVEVALFNKKRKWLKDGGAFQVKRIEVDNKDIIVVFDDLPYGKYAVVSYHDVNNNDHFDRNWFGIPEEPYALSKKAKSKFRKPKFKEMVFELNQPHYILETYFKEL